MLAKDLISGVVPSLKTSDTGLDALNWMEVFRLSHLPIVNNEQFLGLITDTDIYDMKRTDLPIGEHALSLMSPYVFENQHIYAVVEIAARLKLSAIPVLNADKKYLGIITLSNLVWHFNQLVTAATPGGIIELDVHPRDYSLAEIARIIEDVDAQVLSLYVSQNEQEHNYRITIKTNKMETESIRNSFDRFGYSIRVIDADDTAMDVKIQSNYNSLLRYLDI